MHSTQPQHIQMLKPPIDPYTARLTAGNLDELTRIARGQAPGQPNAAAYEAQQRAAELLAARPKTTPHARLTKQIMREVKRAHPTARIEKRNVGRGGYKDKRTGDWRILQFGQVGESDIRVTLQGLAIALEVKAIETRDQQRDSQIRWQARFERAGGYYAVVHSVEEALHHVKLALTRAV